MEATATTIDTAAAAAEPLTVVRNYQERTGLTLVKYQIWITSYNGYNGSDSLTPLSYNQSLLHNLEIVLFLKIKMFIELSIS